jgi:tryptophan 2,3-dioxygenase
MSDSDDRNAARGGEDRFHSDFRDTMSYGDYLRLDRLLSAQKPLSQAHDEHLFIILHQAAELWMKLAIHELRAALSCIQNDDLQPAFKMLARVSRIQAQLIQQWDILSTMTPSEYLTFRDQLGQSSGFQSYQYREIEFLLGNKNRSRIDPHRHREEIHARLQSVLAAPSLYDEAIRLLGRRGFAVDPSRLERDWSERYRPHPSVRDAWMAVYREPERHWDLYELAEKLVDLEDWFQQWRFRHMKTVERIIGFKTGTGGTSGVSYLKKALDIYFFPELWELRTHL